MTDLFDQKSLRIPPMMGKAARTKLNKSGSYRMPPNLKGVHSAAQGGLGGAYTKGKKLRGYAEGGLVGVGGEEIKPTQANFSSGLGDAPEEELTQEIQDDSPEAAQSALDYVGSLKSPSNMNPDDIPVSMDLGSKRIQEELSKYMPYARQQLEGMQNPREGGLNLPMLQFAAGLMSPTRTGSFGESIGTGMNMGLNALANQRKQDLDYQTLKAKLGLDIEKTPLEVATKLADLEDRAANREALADYRQRVLAAKENKKSGMTPTELKLTTTWDNQAKAANDILPEVAIVQEYINDVGSGPIMGSKSLRQGVLAAQKSGIGGEELAKKTGMVMGALKRIQNQIGKGNLAGLGSASNLERIMEAEGVGSIEDLPPDVLAKFITDAGNELYTVTKKPELRLKAAEEGVGAQEFSSLFASGAYNEDIGAPDWQQYRGKFAKDKSTPSAPKTSASNVFDELPDAAQFKGKTFKNPDTGERMQSDGINWKPVQ